MISKSSKAISFWEATDSSSFEACFNFWSNPEAVIFRQAFGNVIPKDSKLFKGTTRTKRFYSSSHLSFLLIFLLIFDPFILFCRTVAAARLQVHWMSQNWGHVQWDHRVIRQAWSWKKEKESPDSKSSWEWGSSITFNWKKSSLPRGMLNG